MATGNKPHSKVSISCFDVPIILFNKVLAKRYFQNFGKVVRIKLRPKQNVCIVEFSNEEDAKRAYEESGNYEGQNFKVSWTGSKSKFPNSSEKKKGAREKKLDPDWPMDLEVQAELEAMNTLTTSRLYNLRPESISPSPKAKKSPSTKKSEKSGKWKNEKPSKKADKNIMSSAISNEQEQELLIIISKPAANCEEKFFVLDARDKLIRLKNAKQASLKNSRRTIGTCPDMCPEKERLMRETRHQVKINKRNMGKNAEYGMDCDRKSTYSERSCL